MCGGGGGIGGLIANPIGAITGGLVGGATGNRTLGAMVNPIGTGVDMATGMMSRKPNQFGFSGNTNSSNPQNPVAAQYNNQYLNRVSPFSQLLMQRAGIQNNGVNLGQMQNPNINAYSFTRPDIQYQQRMQQMNPQMYQRYIPQTQPIQPIQQMQQVNAPTQQTNTGMLSKVAENPYRISGISRLING
jgi:hypothetical protein